MNFKVDKRIKWSNKEVTLKTINMIEGKQILLEITFFSLQLHSIFKVKIWISLQVFLYSLPQSFLFFSPNLVCIYKSKDVFVNWWWTLTQVDSGKKYFQLDTFLLTINVSSSMASIPAILTFHNISTLPAFLFLP